MPLALTKRAARVINLARDIAQRSALTKDGDLAVLIAVVEEDGGIGAELLRELGLDLPSLYAELPAQQPMGPSTVDGDIDGVLQLADHTAREKGAAEIGTEHLVLSMARDSTSAAHAALKRAGITELAITLAALGLEKS